MMIKNKKSTKKITYRSPNKSPKQIFTVALSATCDDNSDEAQTNIVIVDIKDFV